MARPAYAPRPSTSTPVFERRPLFSVRTAQNPRSPPTPAPPPAEVRASRSWSAFAREREEAKSPLGPPVAMDRWLVERNRLVPPPQPMLAVDNFNLENLEGTPAPPNSTSQDRRFSPR